MFVGRVMLLALVSVVLLANGSRADAIPPAALAALEKAAQFELYSLEPSDRENKDGERFHGWKVLGKATVKDKDARQRVIASLKKGAEENDGVVANCFEPRHGIQVTHDGKTISLVICFQCLSAQMFVDGKRDGGYLTTGSPQPVLDKVLKDASIPLAKKPSSN